MVLPSQVFFTPNDFFWQLLDALAEMGVNVVDCGCGMGTLLDAAEARGFSMLGYDTHEREGQSSKVLHQNVLGLRIWSPTIWPMVCRPSHSSWVWDLMDLAKEHFAYGLYVGLPRNVKIDLPESVLCKVSRVPVGVEGEYMYAVRHAGSPNGAGIVAALRQITPKRKEPSNGPQSNSARLDGHGAQAQACAER